MTSGEMDYEEVFRFIGFQDAASADVNDTIVAGALASSGRLNNFTYTILWVIFAILMPILFINLLVSST